MERNKNDKVYSPILWPNSSGNKKKHQRRKAKENREPSKLSLKFSKCLNHNEESEEGCSIPPKNTQKLKRRRSSVQIFARVYNALLADDDAIPNTPSPEKLEIMPTPRSSLIERRSISRVQSDDSWRLSSSSGCLGTCNKALSFTDSTSTPSSILRRACSDSFLESKPHAKSVSYSEDVIEIRDTDDESPDSNQRKVVSLECSDTYSTCGKTPIQRELFKSPLQNSLKNYPATFASEQLECSKNVVLLEGSIVRRKTKKLLTPIILSSSDDEDIPAPLSQRIQFDPQPKMTSRANRPVSEDSDEEFGKILEQMRTPRRKPVILSSDSESERSYLDDSSSDEDTDIGILPRKIPTILPNAAVSASKIDRNTFEAPSTFPRTTQPIITNRKLPITQAAVSCSQPTKSTAPHFRDATETDFFLKSLNVLAERQHPQAEDYRNNFKKRKQELVTVLYKMFNTSIFENKLPSNMAITWNPRMTKTAGYCYYRNEPSAPGGRGARLELSEKVLDSADRLRDTLIHEMCHAASWILNGYRDGHGTLFKYWGKKAKLAFPSLPVISRCHTYAINTKYTYKCQGCSGCIGRHSKSLDMSRKVCSRCGGRFKLLINGRRASEMTPRSATPFALFVKENYGKIRGGSKGMKHAEVMKALSAEFAAKAIVKT